ncbi:MAG: hypothetical protein AB7G13_32020 [Lautropia sp.]
MFDAPIDQAEGLRRMFARRPPTLLPVACAAPAAPCRRYAELMLDRFERIGSAPTVIDRLDASDELGRFAVAPGIDRVVLLDDPVRLARWLRGRQPQMLLLLSRESDALPAQYRLLKAIALGLGVRRFAVFVVDATTVVQAAQASARLIECARRFLDVRIEPLIEGAVDIESLYDASLSRLSQFEIPLPAAAAAAAARGDGASSEQLSATSWSGAAGSGQLH